MTFPKPKSLALFCGVSTSEAGALPLLERLAHHYRFRNSAWIVRTKDATMRLRS